MNAVATDYVQTTAMRWHTTETGRLVIEQWWSERVGPPPDFALPRVGEWREIPDDASNQE